MTREGKVVLLPAQSDIIADGGEKESEPSSTIAINTNNTSSTLSVELSNNNSNKQIQPFSDFTTTTMDHKYHHHDDSDEVIGCVQTNNLPKFKSLSAPTPNNHHQLDFSSTTTTTTTDSTYPITNYCTTKAATKTNSIFKRHRHVVHHSHPESSEPLDDDSDNNEQSFKILPTELIFDLIFPFLCIVDIVKFSSISKLYQSYIFHIIEPNDIMWRQQLHNLIPLLNQITCNRILLIKSSSPSPSTSSNSNNNTSSTNKEHDDNIKHQSLIMQGVLQEYILKVRRRIQYFCNTVVTSGSSSNNKAFSIPAHFSSSRPNLKSEKLLNSSSNNTTTRSQIVMNSVLGSDYEGFFELSRGGSGSSSIRSNVISIASQFLKEFQAFSLGNVYIHEVYNPSQYNTTLKRNSLKQLLKTPTHSNDFYCFDNDSYRHQIVNEKKDDSIPMYRMTIVGCSELAVHPTILQTFSKNQFPEDYISIYGQNFSCVSSIKNANNTNQDQDQEETFRLKLVDMPVDVWNSNDSAIYLKSSDTIIVVFNRRFKSSFDRVCNEIIPSILNRKSSTKNPKIVLVGIDWLHTLLGGEQYESLRYKLSVDELLKLEPVSHSKVIRKVSKIPFKKRSVASVDKKEENQLSPLMAYIEFTPKDQNIANDFSTLMDIILKLRVGSSRQVNFFTPIPNNLNKKSSRPLGSTLSKMFSKKKKNSGGNGGSMKIEEGCCHDTLPPPPPPQPQIFYEAKRSNLNLITTSRSLNQIFNRKKKNTLKVKLKSLFSL